MSAVVAVNQVGQLGASLTGFLASELPGERFVACRPQDPPPPEADVLVSLNEGRDAFAGLEQLLTPGIRWVHLLSTGIDGFPLAAVGDRIVTCSRGASAVAIAEWVLAAMLAFEKQLPETWIDRPPEARVVPNLGTLAGRRVGLVGVGCIGAEVSRRCLAFDMEVLAVRRRATVAPPSGVTLVDSLPGLASRVEHLVVAAPATPATARIVNQEVLDAGAPGLHLVNVARGSLVDHDALLSALDRGHVARATLDVTDPEPLPAGHPLYRHRGVRLTPHVSWSAPGTVPKTIAMFVDNVRRYRAGQVLTGLVDVAAGY